MILRPYRGPPDNAHVAALDQLMGAGILNFCTPATDIVFADTDGGILGYGRIWLSERDGVDRYFLEVSARDNASAPVVQNLFDWVHREAAERARRQHGGNPAEAKFFVTQHKKVLETMLQKSGYEVERTDLIMRRALAGDWPAAKLPAGFELRQADSNSNPRSG